MSIYDYLHEKCIIYQVKKQKIEEAIENGEDFKPEEWMDGQWYPLRSQIDPATFKDQDVDEFPNKSPSLFFPLKGYLITWTNLNINDVHHSCFPRYNSRSADHYGSKREK